RHGGGRHRVQPHLDEVVAQAVHPSRKTAGTRDGPLLLPQRPPDRQQPEPGDEAEERSVGHAALLPPSSSARSCPARAKRSACGGCPSPRTSQAPRREKTSVTSMTSSSPRPLRPTTSRTRRRPSARMSRWTTRSMALATVGTTKRLETFSPASSGSVHSFVTASRAECAGIDASPGSPLLSAISL